jgi:hypothetical protein
MKLWNLRIGLEAQIYEGMAKNGVPLSRGDVSRPRAAAPQLEQFELPDASGERDF